LSVLTDEKKEIYRELWNDLEVLKTANTEIRNIIFQKSVLSNLYHLFKVLLELDPAASWDERIDKYIAALNVLYQKKIFDRNGNLLDFSLEEFLSSVSQGKYGLKNIKLWDGVLNDSSGGILYKDSDAPKIGHLIIILACSVYEKNLSFEDMNKNALSKSVLKVRDSLRTFYLNKIKLEKSFNTQMEVWNNIFTHSDNKEELNSECIRAIKKMFDFVRS
jgi:hypothetical protein